MKELIAEPLIVYPHPCDVRNQLIEVFHNHGIDPKLSHELAFGESILGFVAAGAGSAILPETLAKNSSQLPVRTIPIVDFNQLRTISLLSRKEALGKKVYQTLCIN